MPEFGRNRCFFKNRTTTDASTAAEKIRNSLNLRENMDMSFLPAHYADYGNIHSKLSGLEPKLLT